MAKKINSRPGLRRFDVQMLEKGAQLGFREVEPDWAECYFCDALNTQDSKEHVFPQWLLSLEGVRGELFNPQYFGNLPSPDPRVKNVPTHVRPAAPAQHFVATNICRVCNNGWMSKCELGYKRYYEGALDADPADAVRWFVKTAFVIAVSQNRRLQVPRDIRIALAAGSIHERVSVYFHTENVNDPERGIFDFAQAAQASGIVFASGHRDAILQSLRRLWACSIRVNNVVGTVIVNPPGESWASSWETRGAQAIVNGIAKPEFHFEDATPITHYSHGVCLVPLRTAWHNAFGSAVKDVLPWPQGLYGIGEVSKYLMAAADKLQHQQGVDAALVRMI